MTHAQYGGVCSVFSCCDPENKSCPVFISAIENVKFYFPKKLTKDIAKIILFCCDEITNNHNWQPFEDLVLGGQFSHAGQLDYLQNSYHRENGIHPGNGWGKTSAFAKKHLYFILKHFADGTKYKTLNVAITQDQAELVQDEICRLVQNSPLLVGWLIKPNASVKFPHAKIKYCNGAQTEFKTTKKKGESIEGKEYGFITADEIALEIYLEFIREKILLPRLRAWKDAQLDFGATPKGYTAFYRILEDIKRHGGYVRGGSSYENPHIDHGLLDYFVRTWSPSKVEQVIHGRFIDTAEMMFASRVEKIFSDELTLEEVVPGRSYLEGWDLARGRKKTADSTVGFRIDMSEKPYRIVQHWAFQLPWTEKERENINNAAGGIKERSSIEREIRKAQAASGARSFVDSTGLGDTLFGMVQDIARPVDFRGGRKDELLDHLQAVIDADLIKSPFIPALAEEMTMYQRDDKGLSTDHLMALAIACSAIPVQSVRFVSMVSNEEQKTPHGRAFFAKRSSAIGK